MGINFAADRRMCFAYGVAEVNSQSERVMPTFEKHLDTLAAEDEGTRVEVVQVAEPGETPTLEFRMQRHGDSLGWVTHRRIRLEAGQIGELKQALSLMDPDARNAEPKSTSPDVHSLLEVVDDDSHRSSG